MRVLFLSSICFLARIFASVEAGDPLFGNITVLYSKECVFEIKEGNTTNPRLLYPGDILSYGIQIDKEKILLPANADEFYEFVGDINFYFGEHEYLSSGFFKKLFGNHFGKGVLTQLNDGAFILDAPLLSPAAPLEKNLKISRYPFCNNEVGLRTTIFNGTNSIIAPLYQSSWEDCESFFPGFNWKKQVCSDYYNQTTAGIPLISNFDDDFFLVGLSDPRSIANSTLYNLIVDECYGFPVYKHCDFARFSSPSKYTFCNSAEISLNLEGINGIVLFGNVQDGIGNTSFIPFGLGTVVSDNQVILPYAVLDSLDDYKIYGNGKKLKLAFMMNRKVTIFEPVDYMHIKAFQRMLKLVKFTKNVFQNVQKAKFSFDESQKSLEEIETFHFFDEKLLIRKRQGNDKNANLDDENFLIGAPVYFNGTIIGFQNQFSFVSTSELKSLLPKMF